MLNWCVSYLFAHLNVDFNVKFYLKFNSFEADRYLLGNYHLHFLNTESSFIYVENIDEN